VAGSHEHSNEHREAAELALLAAQRNPIMSADQSFSVAMVHALLAIEERLADLLSKRTPQYQ